MDSNFFSIGIVEAVNKVTRDREWLTRLILGFFLLCALLSAFAFALIPSIKKLLELLPSDGDVNWWEVIRSAITFLVGIAVMYVGGTIMSRRELSRIKKNRDEVFALWEQTNDVMSNARRRDQLFNSNLRTFGRNADEYSGAVMRFAAAVDDPVLKGHLSSLAEHTREINKAIKSCSLDHKINELPASQQSLSPKDSD